jgi:hypothetical protein
MIQDLPPALVEAVKKKLKEDEKEKDDKDKEDEDPKKKKGEKIDVEPQISDPYSPSTVRTQ